MKRIGRMSFEIIANVSWVGEVILRINKTKQNGQ